MDRPAFARVRAITVSQMWIGRVMPDCRTIPFRVRAMAGATIALAAVLAVVTACNAVHATSPNPGDTMPGKQDMFVVVTNGTWNLVGFVATLTGISASGTTVHVTPSASVMHSRAATGRSAGTDSISATFVITGPPTGTDLLTPTYEAFDRTGNVWMSVHGTAFNGSIIEYTPTQQKTGDSVPPAVGIGGLQYPQGISFDQSGNLWVLDSQTNRLVEYGPDKLAHSGSPVPTATVSLDALNVVGSTYAPLILAIDAHGNFWISANIQNRPASSSGDSLPAFVVSEFTSSQIAAGGTPTPVLKIAMPGLFPGGYGPGIAFDSVGNLWTANADSATLTKFPASRLTAGANPLPTIRIGHLLFGGALLDGISDVGIDPAGIMFVATGYAAVPGAAIYGFVPSQLAVSGSPAPVIVFIPTDGITHLATRP